ncbi:MAG: 30S ribosomal protein S17 [Bdellovibrionota bacterium]
MTKQTQETKAIVKPKREETGIVISNKMTKTIVVKLDRRTRHAKYGKFITKSKKIKAHDEENAAKIGDLVTVVATRPISKDKRYALKVIVRKASGV